MTDGNVDPAIVTPASRPGFLGGLASGQWLPGLAARLGAALARRRPSPLRLGKNVIVIRHDSVVDCLSRDFDFGIAAVNEKKIGEVNQGAFILGMDRSAVLERERRALYTALHQVDMDALRRAAAQDIAATLADIPAGGEIDVVSGYARPVAARTASRLFGISGPGERMFMEVARSIFAHTFLNLGDDEAIRARAIRAGDLMARWLSDEIDRRLANGVPGEDLMGRLLANGELDRDGVRRSLGGMLVGSIDTTASAVAKIVAVVVRDQALQRDMRRDLNDLDRLYGWCQEALRRWPHNPIVIRKASVDTDLGGCAVKAGDKVYAWTQAAMLDRGAFPDPHRARPDRDRAAYLHLGGGVHPCAGRPVNRFQIPLLVHGLLARGPDRLGRIGWAGPFPDRVPVRLSKGGPA